MGRRSRRDPDGHGRRGKGRPTQSRPPVESGRFAVRADDEELDSQRKLYAIPFEAHPCFANPDLGLPDQRRRIYATEGMNCLRAATALVLDVPYDEVPAGLARGGSGITNAARPFRILAEWAEWAGARGLVPCMYTAAHPAPTDRDWWIALVARVQGLGVNFNTYAMHHGQVVHSPLVDWEGVPDGPWYGLTLDSEHHGGFRLREHLAEFATPEEFLWPVVTEAYKLARYGPAKAAA